MSDQIRVGQVSHRKGFRLHANVDGRAYCGAGNGRIIATTTRTLTADLAPLVCRRCRKHLLAAAQQAEVTANMRAGHSTTHHGTARATAAEALVRALETGTDRRHREHATDAFRRTRAAILAETDTLALAA
jgi:hypothetical protein